MTTPNSINWDGLLEVAKEAKGGEVLPANDYHVVVDKASAVKTANGKDSIKVEFRVASGPHQGKGPIYNQFTVSPDNPNAMSFFFQHMAVFGLTTDYLKEKRPTMSQIATHMVGKQCKVKVVHGTWNDKVKMEVKKIEKVSGAMPGIPSGPPSISTPVAPPASNGVAPAAPVVPPTPEPPTTATAPPEAPF